VREGQGDFDGGEQCSGIIFYFSTKDVCFCSMLPYDGPAPSCQSLALFFAISLAILVFMVKRESSNILIKSTGQEYVVD
jgi:hypothetical protein